MLNDTKLVLDKLSAASNTTEILNCLASIHGPWALLYWQVTQWLIENLHYCISGNFCRTYILLKAIDFRGLIFQVTVCEMVPGNLHVCNIMNSYIIYIELNWQDVVWQRCVWSKEPFVASSS